MKWKGLPLKIFPFTSRRRELNNVKRTQVPRSPESWVPACKAEWEPDHHVSRPARHICNAQDGPIHKKSHATLLKPKATRAHGMCRWWQGLLCISGHDNGNIKSDLWASFPHTQMSCLLSACSRQRICSRDVIPCQSTSNVLCISDRSCLPEHLRTLGCFWIFKLSSQTAKQAVCSHPLLL